MKLFFLLLLLFFHTKLLIATENLDTLLNGYESESSLSKITKRDAGGVVEIFTHEDLEQMQAHTLLDVINSTPALLLTRGVNNFTRIAIPSVAQPPITYIRLYINDHDITSSSFGSGFLIWGEMPIEYIDHIEIYKATSSIEFGNENAMLIFRLYTKTAQRNSGSKIRIMADDKASLDTSFYTAQNLLNDISYFAFANGTNINNTSYHNIYNGKTYDYNSNRENYNVYGDIHYKGYRVELNIYKKRADSFIGIGIHKTPDGGELDAKHIYLHVTKEFQNNVKLQLSYDKSQYSRSYIDPNGIRISNAPIINDYGINFDDDIASVILEKRLNFGDNSLLLGGFYKRKEFEVHGRYFDNNFSYDYSNHASNALNLYSLYAQNRYNYNQNIQLITSLKGDFFRYNKDVKSQNELLARVGLISKIDTYKMKFFYSKAYTPLAFYQIYNPDNIPYKANPQLNTMQTGVYTASLSYTNKYHQASFAIVHVRTTNLIKYDTTSADGFYNSNDTINQILYQFDYTYKFDIHNKLVTNFIYGDNSTHTDTAPQYEALFKLFNKYKKFDFYNELIYKSSYSLYGIDVPNSYEFNMAVKYHYNKDLSLGLKADNIFNSGYKQEYKDITTAIETREQRFWFNLEYLF
ncbi:TonB-dependent receptor plug domain-containing protein [Sulfurimonas sp.]